MNQIYYQKKEFIKDFISLCRRLKKENSGLSPVFLYQLFAVCGECWSFRIYIDGDTISTSALLNMGEKAVEFPKTAWGGPYRRWDSELREFLDREICK